ncbi:MAG: tetratricopeptide repeat protein [Candidatus Krumholzibacteria bacterium]|nr:tetratricopeptide repeat protein [Candidatus Krumholzibacteria bacterium]
MKILTQGISTIIILAMLSVMAASCGGGGDLYDAEKDLFNARKMNRELVVASMNREFLTRTLAAYRGIVDKYEDKRGNIEGMEMIVVSALMELAELEFRAGMIEEARNDFAVVADMKETITEARANAIWSAGYISLELDDYASSLRFFEMFVSEYLTPDKAEATFHMNSRYLVTPVRIAGIHSNLGAEKDSGRWLGKAEKIFNDLIASSTDSLLVRETRYNLLTALLQGKKWNEARTTIAGMKQLYRNPSDIPSLLFLESRTLTEGLGRPERAIPLLKEIIDEYPDSHQTLPAMIDIAGIYFTRGELRKAEKIYNEIIEEHGGVTAQAAEAAWQLARIAESENDWVSAALHYKLTYTHYPATIQGMEAPLRIVTHFRELGEKEATTSAFDRAMEQFKKLISDQYNKSIRILAEEYIVRAFSEDGRWDEAAEHLLGLPAKYPDYHKFRGNYLLAASIFEKELGDKDRATEILTECIGKYPDSGIDAEAQKQIDRIRDSR